MPHSVRVILKKALHKGAITSADYEKVMRNVIQVRCKDCVHWGSTISQDDREQCASQGVDLVCNYWETDGLYAEDFCSYGERRDDAEIH